MPATNGRLPALPWADANAVDALRVADVLGLTAAREPRKFACVWCDSSDALHAYPDGRVHCFACSHDASNVDVAAHVWGLAPADAVRRLAPLLGIPVPDDSPAPRLRAPLAGDRVGPWGAGAPDALQARHDALAADRAARRLVARYPYTDADGRLLYEVRRFDPKDFRPFRPDGRAGLGDAPHVLYRLPEVRAAVARGVPVFWCEGEKDADALAALGFAATTLAGGAGARWRDEFGPHVRGARVVLVPDADPPGAQYAARIAAALDAAGAADVRVLTLPGLSAHGDLSDWLAAGGTRAALVALAEAAPRWTPGPAPDVPMPGATPEPLARTLADLLADPALLAPPVAVLPGIGFAGRSTLLAGREKGGKTTLAAAGAAAVSRGRGFLGAATIGGPVLWCGLEEHAGDIVRRFAAQDADPARVHIAPRLPNGVDDLRALVAAIQPVLVIVDTLAAFATATVEDFNSAAQWLPVITGLTTLAHDSGAALLLLHHASKATGRYRDSTAIGGGVDAIVELSDPEVAGDPSRRELRARGRMPLEDFAIQWDGAAFTRITAGNAAPVELRVLAHLRANPGSSKRAIRAAMQGVGARKVDAAIEALMQHGAILRDDDGFHATSRAGASESPGVSIHAASGAHTQDTAANLPGSTPTRPPTPAGHGGVSRVHPIGVGHGDTPLSIQINDPDDLPDEPPF